jgi:hypothetical protein
MWLDAWREKNDPEETRQRSPNSRNQRNIELFPLVVAGDKAARDEMIAINVAHLPKLVNKHISRNPSRELFRDDLMSLGGEAIWQAVDRIAAGKMLDGAKVNSYIRNAAVTRFWNAPRTQSKDKPLTKWIDQQMDGDHHRRPTVQFSGYMSDDAREELERCCQLASGDPEEVAIMLGIVDAMCGGAETISEIAKQFGTDSHAIERRISDIAAQAEKRGNLDPGDFRGGYHTPDDGDGDDGDDDVEINAETCPICYGKKFKRWEHCGSRSCQEDYARRDHVRLPSRPSDRRRKGHEDFYQIAT